MEEGRTPEESFPVAYVRNVHPEVTSKHKVTPTTYSGTLKIQGKSSFTVGSTLFNFTFAQKPVTFASGTGTYPRTKTQSGGPGELPPTVRIISFPTEWEVSRTGNANTWKSVANQSANTMYVLLDNPAAPQLFRTVLHLACMNGGAANAATAKSNTWGLFGLPANAGPANVKSWNLFPLTYYATLSGGLCTDTAPLLKTREGQCHAFASLLKDVFAANGITTGIQITRVRPPVGLTSLAVKNIIFKHPPTSPSTAPFVYAQGDLLLSDPDLKGQNTAPPKAKLFEQHFIVHDTTGAIYYDPSYGVTTTGEADYTLRAIDGYSNDFGDHWRKIHPHAPADNLRFDP